MAEIIMQAPIQARPDTVSKHERLFPLLATEALVRIMEYQSGLQYPRVDVWNATGEKVDKIYLADNPQDLTRFEYSTNQIDARYALLREFYGLDRANRVALRDDGNEYQRIVKEHVRKFIGEGVFQVKQADFTSCNACDYIIAPLAAQINKCPSCHSTSLGQQTRMGLFVDLDVSTKDYIKDGTHIFPRHAATTFRGMVDNLPKSVQISKKRSYGINLTEFGVSDDLLLDPKIALAMSTLVIREMGLGYVSTVIQGIDSLVNTVPFTALVDDSEIKYVGLGLIPKYKGNEITNDNRGFYTTFLPLVMFSNPGNLTNGQKSSLEAEYSKSVRKFENTRSYLSQPDRSGTIFMTENHRQEVQQILSLLVNYDCRNAILAFRDFTYRILSGDYGDQRSKLRVGLSSHDLNKLNDVFKLVYGR